MRDGGRHRKICASRAPRPLCAYFMLLRLKKREKTPNPVTTVMGKRESTQEQNLTSHQKHFRDIRIRSKLPKTHISYFLFIKKVMYVHVTAKHDTC